MFTKQQLPRVQRRGPGDRAADDGEQHLAGVAAEQHGHGGLHPLPQLAALLDGVQQALDPGVDQHHVGRHVCRVAAAGDDADADRGGPDGGGVVGAVTDHRGAHTRRSRASERPGPCSPVSSGRRSPVRSRRVLDPCATTTSHSAPLITCSAVTRQPELLGDGLGGDRMVAGDQLHAHRKPAQIREQAGRFGARGVGQAEEPGQGQPVPGEIGDVVGLLPDRLSLGGAQLRAAPPRSPAARWRPCRATVSSMLGLDVPAGGQHHFGRTLDGQLACR